MVLFDARGGSQISEWWFSSKILFSYGVKWQQKNINRQKTTKNYGIEMEQITMQSKNERWPLLSFKEYKDDINPKPKYQRQDSWNIKQKQMLIDSIIRKIDIPKLYLRENPNNGKYSYEMIDGQQRMRTMWEFLQGDLRLSEEAEDILIGDKIYKIAGCTYLELEQKIKMERIHKYTLDVVIIYDATEDEIADLFYRLNNGTPLSPAEVRNCMSGVMGNVIREIAGHTFFKKVCFTNKKYAHQQIVAQMMLLELNGGIEETRDRILTKMYANYSEKVPLKTIENLKNILDLLNLIFEDKSRLLNKTSIINLYLILSYLSKSIKFKKDFYKKVYDWFVMSEPVRAKSIEYKLFMTSSVNSPQSIEGRFKIILIDFLTHFNDIQLISFDTKRYFDEIQKAEIYSINKGVCQGCFKKLRENDWESDHKTPWIKGGSTTVENGQVLCKPCNLKKRDKLW